MAETFIAVGAAVKSAAAATAASVSSFFAGTGAAAAGTGAAAAGAAGGAGALSTALTVGSALASIGTGFANARAQRDQAKQVAVQAAQQKAQDSQRRATLAEEYADLVSQQQAIQIANGLNPGVGTPATVRSATRTFAERNLSTSRENTRMRMQTARLRQRSLMRSANTATVAGFVGAGQTFMDNYRTVG